MATIPETLALAVQHHQAGRLQDAEQIYRQILAVDPNQADALHLLGVSALQVGQPAVAVQYIERAIALKRYDLSFHNNLGEAYRSLGNMAEAVASYRRALELQPDNVVMRYNLGTALRLQGEQDAAVACFRRVLELKPDFADAHYNLGNALKSQGKLNEAVVCYSRALELKPNFVDAHINLGLALKTQGKLDEAVASFRRALDLKPDCVEAYNNLGNALKEQSKLDEAIWCYHRALERKTDLAEVHNNLGSALKEQGKLDDAAACYRRALELNPAYAESLSNLGNAFKDLGKLEDAVACYRRALELKPDSIEAHSNLVLALNYCLDIDAQAIHDECQRWNDKFAMPLAKAIQPHVNDRSVTRRLRIGYVSPGFAGHSVCGLFLTPLCAHDHQNYEIFCYADVVRPDKFTERLRSCADGWRNIVGLTDEQVAQLIREDRIDILVDLTMHMAHNRLLVFARKPAPVQVSWLAYPGSSGLGTIDYRLTDPYLDPPGYFDRYYAEESIRLPETFWCYDPLTQEPAVNPLPAFHNGHVTFGCLNNFCKINAFVLKLWAQILSAVPQAHLMILAPEGSCRQNTLAVFEREGIAPARLTFIALCERSLYLQQYHHIDLGLDAVPYNGHTTSLDSLWMGVPVITLLGKTVVGRGGLSQLTNLGLTELIAETPKQFVRIAVDLANDLPRLNELRASLRERTQASPLMDAPRFARNIEAAYRSMWQRWCAK